MNLRPSQWTNAGVFFLCALTCFLIIPIFVALWYYLVVRSESYELSGRTLTLRSGVLNKNVDDVELYRVKDVSLARPLLLRLAGLGTIRLITSDQSNPTVILRAIHDSEEVRVQLRDAIEESRKARGVREVDTY